MYTLFDDAYKYIAHKQIDTNTYIYSFSHKSMGLIISHI